MKILVTGGAGYLVAKLAEKLLNQGHKITVYDSLFFGSAGVRPFLNNRNYKFIKSNIIHYDLLRAATKKQDYVIHLAAIVGEPSCKQYKDLVTPFNVDASIFLSNTCFEFNIPFIFLSTCSNYGKSKGMVDENSSLQPLGLYSKSKIKAEKVIKKNKQLILRSSTLFGVGYRTRLDITVNEFVYQFYKNKTLKVYGENTWRPYLHIKDASNMITKSMENNLTGIFNMGDNDLNFQKKKIIKIIVEYLGEGQIEYVDFNDPRDYSVNFNKIKKELNYEYKYSIEDGIREVYESLTIAQNE